MPPIKLVACFDCSLLIKNPKQLGPIHQQSLAGATHHQHLPRGANESLTHGNLTPCFRYHFEPFEGPGICCLFYVSLPLRQRAKAKSKTNNHKHLTVLTFYCRNIRETNTMTPWFFVDNLMSSLCPTQNHLRNLQVPTAPLPATPESPFTFVELFAGIGGFRWALQVGLVGWSWCGNGLPAYLMKP